MTFSKRRAASFIYVSVHKNTFIISKYQEAKAVSPARYALSVTGKPRRGKGHGVIQIKVFTPSGVLMCRAVFMAICLLDYNSTVVFTRTHNAQSISHIKACEPLRKGKT